MPETFSSLLKDEVSASVVLGPPEKMAKSRECGADSARPRQGRAVTKIVFAMDFKIAHKGLQTRTRTKTIAKSFFN